MWKYTTVKATFCDMLYMLVCCLTFYEDPANIEKVWRNSLG